MKVDNRRMPICRLALVTALTLLFTIPLFLGPSFGPSAWRNPGQAWAVKAKKGAYTPAPGSAEHRAIVAALQKELEKLHHLKMIFTVKYLKVHQGWAWIHVQPRSPDGTKNYEDVNALLRNEAGCWQVAEIACAEEDNPDCLGAPDYFKKLRARFPAAPPDIFPAE